MEQMRDQIPRTRASREQKKKFIITNLNIEDFCAILEFLPNKFKLELSNVAESLSGCWEKRIYSALQLETVWRQDRRVLYGSDLFSCKEEVFQAIEKEGWRPLDDLLFKYFKARIKKGEIIQTPNKEQLEELYIEQKKSLGDIARDFGCSKQHILSIMKQYGVDRRSYSIAGIEAIKKGKRKGLEYHEIKEDYFSEWSSGMAWVLGLLFTDGVMQGNMVRFTSADIELLNKVRTLFQSSRPIQKKTQSNNKSKDIYLFSFSHPNTAKDLRKLGMHEKKSLNMIFPDIPEEYKKHFIRGCWDGDGSIFVSEGKLRASYVCGSLKFIEGLVEELYKIGIHKIKRPIKRMQASKMLLKYPDGRFPLTIHKSKRSRSYDITIDRRENLEKLFNYFYGGVDESMYLERKFKTFARDLSTITDGLQVRVVNQETKRNREKRTMPRVVKWSPKFERCVKCGRNDVRHIGRGLCLYCYLQETEERGREKEMIAKGLALGKPDYNYLYEEYVNKQRSLSDIAKDCSCSRQYVSMKMKEFGIRARRGARKIERVGELKWEISERLRMIRESESGALKTQKAMARFIGVRYRTYQNWELGLCPPKLEMIEKIGKLFGYNSAWITFGSGDPKAKILKKKNSKTEGGGDSNGVGGGGV